MESPSKNPYQAPNAHTLAAEDEPYTPRVFSFTGRIGRARYVAYSMWLPVLLGVVGAFLMGAIATLVAGLSDEIIMRYALMMGFGLYIPVLSILLAAAKRRLNDLAQSGWWALLLFLPFMNALLFAVLAFKAGESKANRFGPPPADNSLGVIVFGVAMPILVAFLVLVLAALPMLLGYSTVFQGI